MKLPFKFPTFKLPAFKLPTFGKKKAGDEAEDDYLDDLEELAMDTAETSDPVPDGEAAGEAVASPEDGAPPDQAALEASVSGDGEGAGETDAATPEPPEGDPSALAALEDSMVDDSQEYDDDEDDDFVEGKGLEGKKRLYIMIGAAVGGVLLLAGIAWFVFSGGDNSQHASKGDSGVPVFEMAIPPKSRAAVSGSLNAIAKGAKGPGAGIVAATSTMGAYANITPPQVTDGPLPAIKDPALVEQSSQGPLPKIAADGRLPWKVYAKSVDGKDNRPKVAIIVVGLGMGKAPTEAAITLRPGAVTLAFDPYGQDLAAWADKARQGGHETMMMVPLEPSSFPVDDPGPQALMTTNKPTENLLRLEFVLSRIQRYVGVITVMGSKFNKDEARLETFLKIIKSRGLMFVDGSADDKSLAPGIAEKVKLPKAYTDFVLDSPPTKKAMDAKLIGLEKIAKADAVAVAIIEAYPVSIGRIAAWAAGLKKKNIVLVPASAVIDSQFLK